MDLERITALARSSFAASGSEARDRPAGSGSGLTASRAPSSIGNGESPAEAGVTLELSGLGQLVRDFEAGDTNVLARLMAQQTAGDGLYGDTRFGGGAPGTPELGRAAGLAYPEGAGVPMASAAATDTLREVPAPPLPDAATLADDWLALANQRWSTNAARPLTPTQAWLAGVAPDATVVGTGAGPAAAMEVAGQHDTAPSSPPVSDPHAQPWVIAAQWLIPAYAWNGLPVTLGLVPSPRHAGDEDEARADDQAPAGGEEQPGAEDPASSEPAVVQVELSLPVLGRIALQVRALQGGVQLTLVVEDVPSLPVLRAALPIIDAAMGRAGIRLVDSRLRRRQPLSSVREEREAATHHDSAGAAPTLSPMLFRAAAEAALALAMLTEGRLPSAASQSAGNGLPVGSPH